MSDFVDFTINNTPIVWGAILYATTPNKISYPISSSITDLNLSTILHSHAYNYLMVMPGFEAELYSGAGYTGTLLGSGYNTYGFTPIVVGCTSTTAVSVRLYFKGTVI